VAPQIAWLIRRERRGSPTSKSFGNGREWKYLREWGDGILCELRTYVRLAPYVVPAQLLGYHNGIKEGLNPDEPRNLSRVVILN
jgi:hypothetical protein